MSEKTTEQGQLKKNRRVILAIFGIPVAVIILSSVLYYLVESKALDLGTVNHGELITPPLPFHSLSMTTAAGDDAGFNQAESKWSFVVIGDRHCAGSCERMLYIARQSIIALAKKMGRVRLLYITTDEAISNDLSAYLETEYRGMDVVALPRQALDELFVDAGVDPVAARQFFVVDPRGWLMMRYQVDNTEQTTLNNLGKAVVRDMKRLIK